MSEYRVKLDVYNGPMDLLLYLIRREEVDIHDIPIAHITQQYVEYVNTIERLDPDLAGEFLVLAATLLEIKTRMLLPRQEAADGSAADAFDPRAELVRQLLEYKAFKDAAGDLRSAAEEASLRFGRRPEQPPAASNSLDMEDVQIWDLVEAFNSVLKSIGQNIRETEIIYDDTPIEMHAEDIVDRLQREGDMTFRQVFAGRTVRTELVGLFLAMLELIRRRRIRVFQEETFGEIKIHYVQPAEMAAAASEAATAPAEEQWHGHPAHESHGHPGHESENTGQDRGQDAPETHGQDAHATTEEGPSAPQPTQQEATHDDPKQD